MRDVSLHLLDLARNCTRAGAKHVWLTVVMESDGWLMVTLKDDGCGMAENLLNEVLDPFKTSRTTRKVGLGLPLALESCKRTGGDLTIQSRPGAGTQVLLRFDTRHIDCIPLGDLAETLLSMVMEAADGGADIAFKAQTASESYVLDTVMLKEQLAPVSLNEPEVLQAIKEDVISGLEPLLGGISR